MLILNIYRDDEVCHRVCGPKLKIQIPKKKTKKKNKRDVRIIVSMTVLQFPPLH